MANQRIAMQNIGGRLQAKTKRFLAALAFERKNDKAPTDGETSTQPPRSTTISPEYSLCGPCGKIDLSTIFGKRRVEFNYDLGLVQDIINKEYCSLCRLVSASLRLNWSYYPLQTKAGELVRCRLLVPSLAQGCTTGEVSILLSIDTNNLPEKLQPLSTRQTLKLLVDDLGWFNPFRRTEMAHWVEECLASATPLSSRAHFGLVLIPMALNMDVRVEAKSYARNLRVIDVQDDNIVDAPPKCDYVALSYVWGRSNFLRLLKDNKAELASSGALKRATVPRTIRDAMQLVTLLGKRYLWVDALCIVQDDDSDKGIQIGQMDIIYTSAILTIVAASGTDAEAGLPGLNSGSRQIVQHIESIKGLHFVANGPELISIMAGLRWNTRGWTFQEIALSRRVLCFTPNQCYYLCNMGVKSEDTVPENPAAPYRNSQEPPPEFQLNIRNGLWQCYREIVETYSKRKFTCENDVNDGVDGLLSSLSTFEDEAFICGLPETLLEIALLWLPTGPLRRRSRHRDGSEFPSWSWTGWVGPVHYPSYLPSSGDIHAEVTDWKIEFQESLHKLFVDPEYITTGIRIVPKSQGAHDVTRPQGSLFRPSPWRKALRHTHRAKSPPGFSSRSGLARERPSAVSSPSTEPTRLRIQTGALTFTTKLATFMIYNSSTHHPAITTFSVNSPRRPCALLHQTDTRPNRPSVITWVGTVFIEKEYADTLLMLSQGEFIVLSSADSEIIPLSATGLTQRPEKGLVYSEVRFGPLPASVEGQNRRRSAGQLFNVMWIKWGLEYSSRLGIGQIHRDGWELADSVARKIKLR
ncbi:HET-domain-containing protein [Lentithecium fluviatile CBS 122367]|uniref:HET-domain-containing protein n=1 Tax=Lentithecium fluviatile CBS 122367 TaxID=1168545 RepID=A0A6G1IHV6_9PLEO|nr:HET-domain-containing protein [Lentithecium fluviatile CBS 122367]